MNLHPAIAREYSHTHSLTHEKELYVNKSGWSPVCWWQNNLLSFAPRSHHLLTCFNHHFILNPLILISRQHLFYVCSFQFIFFCSIVVVLAQHIRLHMNTVAWSKNVYLNHSFHRIYVFLNTDFIYDVLHVVLSIFVQFMWRCPFSAFHFFRVCFCSFLLLRFVFKISAIIEQKQTDQGFILIM